MKTQKITLAIIIMLAVSSLTACNGGRDKSNTDSQAGQPTNQSQTAGNDSSHTTDNRRNEVGGIIPNGTLPRGNTNTNTNANANSNTNANGTTTAQGMTGADSVYQKSTQKSPK